MLDAMRVLLSFGAIFCLVCLLRALECGACFPPFATNLLKINYKTYKRDRKQCFNARSYHFRLSSHPYLTPTSLQPFGSWPLIIIINLRWFCVDNLCGWKLEWCCSRPVVLCILLKIKKKTSVPNVRFTRGSMNEEQRSTIKMKKCLKND